jgi:hypothetical protein
MFIAFLLKDAWAENENQSMSRRPRRVTPRALVAMRRRILKSGAYGDEPCLAGYPAQ